MNTTSTAVKTSLHPTPSPGPTGGEMSAKKKRSSFFQPSAAETVEPSRSTGFGRFPPSLSLSLTLYLSLSLSLSVSLCFSDR